LYICKKLNPITAETNCKLPGQYWEELEKHGLPNYLYLQDELVIVNSVERRKRKNGARVDQVYYILSDGRVKHASFFKKIDIKTMKRDYLLNIILNE
jgi:hypothetical protein